MPAAIDDGGKLYARITPAHVQRADPLGSVNLVCRNRKKINIVLLDVHRDLADRLYAIHGENDAVLLRELRDFRDRIDHADFIIRVHDRDQDRRGLDGLPHILRINTPIPLDRQIRHLKPVLLEVLASVQHGLVLDRLRDDVIALLAVHFRNTLDHQVVRFRRATREYDFFRRGIDQRSDLLPSVLHRLFRAPAERMVTAGRIAEFVREIRQHRFEHAWIDRRGRVIVHVNRQLDSHFRVLLFPKNSPSWLPPGLSIPPGTFPASLRSDEQSSPCSKRSGCSRSRAAAVL